MTIRIKEVKEKEKYPGSSSYMSGKSERPSMSHAR